MEKHDLVTLSARVQKEFAEQIADFEINFRELQELEEIKLEYGASRVIDGKKITFTSVLVITANEYSKGIPIYFIDHWQNTKVNRKKTDSMYTLVNFKNINSILEYIELNYMPDIENFES